LRVEKKIAFIGCGNMGEAILRGLLAKRLFKKSSVVISDSRSTRARYIKRSYNIRALTSNKEAVRPSSIVMLCVKPQDTAVVLEGIGTLLRDKLVISIVAGITVSYIMRNSNAGKVIRVMPNLAAVVNESVSAMTCGKTLTSGNRKSAEDIFSCIGKVVWLPEKYMNAVTAVSGSGPAYFFLLMESLVKAAGSLGIGQRIAKELVLQTGVGASMLQHSTNVSPSVLRARVTSKGGTTEAALKVFKKRGFEKTIKEAIKAAAERAKELSR